MMAPLSSATLLKAPRRIRFRVISAKKRSTMLSQEAEVGVKCKWKRMGFEPALYSRSLMRGIIVNDEMEIETGGGLLVDQSEKAQELAMSMPRHAGPDNLAIQHVQRCEQGGGAVAFVIVGHGTGTALLHGQSRLSAIEGLDLALFVDAEDQRPVGWIEVEPDHVLHLGREVLVTRDFERFDQMRLEPVRTPYPLDTAVGHPCRRSHAAQPPVGRIRW